MISVRRFSASALVTSTALFGERDLPFELEDLQRLRGAGSPVRSARARARCAPFPVRAPRDLLALGLFARLHLGFVERAAAGDFAALRVLLALDALLGDGAFLQQARPLDDFARGKLRLLRLLVAQRPLLDQFGALAGAADLDLALLLEPRIFGLAVDLQDLALGVEVLGANVDQRALLDLVAHAAARFDRFGELGQAFGVEGVGRIEEFEAGLVEVDDRHVFELQPVRGERFGRDLADLVGVVAALLVHFLQRHLRRDGAHRDGEFAFQQFADAVRLQRTPAERLRGGGDRRRDAPTRTKNSAIRSTRMRLRVISAVCRRAGPRCA